MKKSILRGLTGTLIALLPAVSLAQLQANFRADLLDYDGNTGDCDPTIFGLPTCELYFRMGIFVLQAQQGELVNFPGECTYVSREGGAWDFPNQTLTRTIPDMSNHALVYLALYDEDPDLTDEDDLLGTHMGFHSGFGIRNVLNNDLQPDGFEVTSCDNGAIDDDSAAERFGILYTVYFTDASAPSPPSQPPTHTDETSGNGWDDDNTVKFEWPAGSDTNSGISEYQYQFRKDGIVMSASTQQARSLSFAPVVEGSVYDIRVRAKNGAALGIENPQWSAWTPWSNTVRIDLTPDTILNLSAYTENGGVPIAEYVAQPDNTPYLEWSVPASTAPIVGYSTATDASPDCVVDTVDNWNEPGPLPNGVTTFYVRAIDEAGNCGNPATFHLVVELTDDVFEDGFESPPET
jgi:type II secretory pathway pseudopilin PulG